MKHASMILHNAPAERAFIAAFDAGRFPYEDAAAASVLIAGAWAVSLNAAFCVLNEICRPSRRVDGRRLRALVAEWEGGPDHPLKAPLLGCADALIRDKPIAWDEGLRLMWTIAPYEAQRAALSIAYFASDSSEDEADAALEAAQQKIATAWDAAGV